MITGANIIGGNGERVENDYYATPPDAVRKLLQVHNFKLENVLEPCVGAGHIASVLSEMVSRRIDCIDIVNRGFPGTIQTDFLKWGGNANMIRS